MQPIDFVKGVLGREAKNFKTIEKRIDERMIRILHATMGFVTESGEIVDQIKKHLYYGNPLDEVNLVEECGDLLFYMAMMLDILGLSFEQAMEINDKKLALRYGKTFSEEAALNRDLEGERKVLEDG